MATNWRVYGKDTVACKLDRSDLPGFFRKKVVVGPNEAAIVVKDGKVHEAITEAKFKTGGILDGIARFFGGGADVEVFFVDLSPIDFTVYLGQTTREQISAAGATTASSSRAAQSIEPDLISASKRIGWVEQTESHAETEATTSTSLDVSQVCILAVSLDQEVVRAECRIRVTVDPDQVKQFIGLVKGKTALATWDIAALVREELLARVLIPEIASHRADELRGNRPLLEKLEQQTNQQLARSFATCGLVLESFTINWGLTDQEFAEIDRKRQEREENALNFTHGRRLAEMGRQQEIQRTRIENLQELKVAEAKGDEGLKDLLLAGDIRRDLMDKGKEVDEAKIDAQVREIELDVEQLESTFRLEQRRADENLRLDVEEREYKQKQADRLAEIDADDKEMQSMVRMQIEMASAKHEREMAQRRHETDAEFRKMQADIEDRYQQRKLKLTESTDRMGMMERLVSQGLNTGAADSSVLNTMLQQATEQEYATTSDEKVEARSKAQAAANDVETFKDAEDRERKHQKDMTGLASDMMEASKQTPGATVVTGAGAPPSQSPVNIVNAPTGAGSGDAAKGNASADANDVEAKLSKLKSLLDAGVITEEDFNSRKDAILDDL